MRQFARIKKPISIPQVACLKYQLMDYAPNFWHSTIDQNRPVGSKATFTEHMHVFYHIVLYTKGQGQYSVDGKFQQAIPGTCVLIQPNQKHDFVTKRANCIYSEITFSYETQDNKKLTLAFAELLSLHAGTKINLPSQLLLTHQQTLALKNILVQITDYLNSYQNLSMYYAHQCLCNIFNILIKNCITYKRNEVIENRFELTKTYIEQHYIESISIDNLAEIACVSKGYFFRAFKKAFDTSPVAYQQSLRLEAAKTLLRTTSLNCNQVAYRTGFKDVYFFHRIFKKRVGETPKQYRKND